MTQAAKEGYVTSTAVCGGALGVPSSRRSNRRLSRLCEPVPRALCVEERKNGERDLPPRE